MDRAVAVPRVVFVVGLAQPGGTLRQTQVDVPVVGEHSLKLRFAKHNHLTLRPLEVSLLQNLVSFRICFVDHRLYLVNHSLENIIVILRR